MKLLLRTAALLIPPFCRFLDQNLLFNAHAAQRSSDSVLPRIQGDINKDQIERHCQLPVPGQSDKEKQNENASYSHRQP